MKKNLLLMTTVCMLASPLSAGAYMVDGSRVDLTSHEQLSGGAWVEITGDGTNAVTFDLGLADGTIADMRAFFFDIDSDAEILSVAVNSLTDLNNDFTPITDVITNWPTVSGSAGMQGAGSFEYGIEFGEGGIGGGHGDISAISFTISGDSVFDIGESNLGMRLMSFGENREDSRKMIGSYESATVPEPTSALLIGLGLAGLAGFRKISRRKANS